MDTKRSQTALVVLIIAAIVVGALFWLRASGQISLSDLTATGPSTAKCVAKSGTCDMKFTYSLDASPGWISDGQYRSIVNTMLSKANAHIAGYKCDGSPKNPNGPPNPSPLTVNGPIAPGGGSWGDTVVACKAQAQCSPNSNPAHQCTGTCEMSRVKETAVNRCEVTTYPEIRRDTAGNPIRNGAGQIEVLPGQKLVILCTKTCKYAPESCMCRGSQASTSSSAATGIQCTVQTSLMGDGKTVVYCDCTSGTLDEKKAECKRRLEAYCGTSMPFVEKKEEYTVSIPPPVLQGVCEPPNGTPPPGQVSPPATTAMCESVTFTIEVQGISHNGSHADAVRDAEQKCFKQSDEAASSCPTGCKMDGRLAAFHEDVSARLIIGNDVTVIGICYATQTCSAM